MRPIWAKCCFLCWCCTSTNARVNQGCKPKNLLCHWPSLGQPICAKHCALWRRTRRRILWWWQWWREAKKNGGRPCKGKRRQFKKIVDKMKLEIENDPFGFNLPNAELPVSISSTEKLRDRVAQILRDYHNEVLERLADQGKDSRTKLSLWRNLSHLRASVQ